MGSFTETNADALRKVQDLLRAQKNERTMRRQSAQQERPSNMAYSVAPMDAATPRTDRHNQQVVEKCRSLSDRLAHLNETLQAVSQNKVSLSSSCILTSFYSVLLKKVITSVLIPCAM